MTFSLADVDRLLVPIRPQEGADLASLARGDLLELQRRMAAAMQSFEVQVASLAGEVARRSTVEDGRAGLARQQGYASPEKFVASVLGTTVSEAAKYVRTGAALSSPQRALVAHAMRGAGLPLPKANLIARTLDRLDGDTRDLERRLVNIAPRLGFDHLQRVCGIEAARFDAADKAARERRLHEGRGLTYSTDGEGMTHVRADLPPVQGAAFIAFLEAQVTAAFQAKRDDDHDTTAEGRTAAQIRADALTTLIMHGMDCTSPTSGVKAQVVIRLDHAQLMDDLALGTCDSLPGEYTYATLRAMAADAGIIPAIMGKGSVVLDWGRSTRLFTPAQKLAIAERDGGCAKCHAPIAMCQTHHIHFWRHGGPTDQGNGVLLCVTCHGDIHHHGWDIEIDQDNHVWFTPPPTVDPKRRRQLGGLAALTTT